MLNLTSPKVVQEIIERYGFKFSKALGQNFLIDSNIVSKIVDFSDINEEDYIIEIGPGIGTLTQVLCERAKKVIAIEIDKKLIPILSENLKEFGNVKIYNNDVLKVNLDEIINEEFEGKKAKIVANLPYYITTPIIMGVLEKKFNIESITIMIQKEVAERINAIPSTKAYGALSVAAQYYSKPILGFVVSKNCFIPQPKVESLVLKLDVLPISAVIVKDEGVFFKLIKAAFGQRRKILLNSIVNSGLFDITKERLKEIFISLNLDENIRGENLNLEQFGELSDKLK